MKRCPHANVLDCPLYYAMHGHGGFGCDDGKLDEGKCGVSRQLDYAHELGRLRAEDPHLVAKVEWDADERARRAQRQRNEAQLRGRLA